jgi:hypothetical protein
MSTMAVGCLTRQEGHAVVNAEKGRAARREPDLHRAVKDNHHSATEARRWPTHTKTRCSGA